MEKTWSRYDSIVGHIMINTVHHSRRWPPGEMVAKAERAQNREIAADSNKAHIYFTQLETSHYYHQKLLNDITIPRGRNDRLG